MADANEHGALAGRSELPSRRRVVLLCSTPGNGGRRGLVQEFGATQE